MPPKRNYKFEKRQKDLAKVKKKEEKKQRQLAKKQTGSDENGEDVEETSETEDTI
ncbi:hypothetical protein [Desulfovibrio gilichinskyi]|uniref:Uncharacterized protein n=1 Tax=Desulfovibrio gilichinskyi TaxID=1519643 RepID=A0A1X7EZL9_9BACT|nr:hypothetical protein [Desulfovibrio gilichinskyi]SMF43105.1 hypothetical protein SAMN06295933_3530 [Desulfovibrio gilichinskyi]